MTVPSEASGPTELAWTGVETAFAAGFRAIAASDLVVTYRNALGAESVLTQGVHYDVTLAADNAATVVPLSLPAAPGTVVMLRQTAAIQGTDFDNLEKYDGGVHEALHDRSMMAIADTRRDLATRLAWAPEFAVVADGDRRVLQVVDWNGGVGAKPAAGDYVGAAGFVAAIADAADVRGPAGPNGPGTGDMIGPASGGDGNLVGFDGPSGKMTKDRGSFANLLGQTAMDNETSIAAANPAAIGAAATVRILITGTGNTSFASAANRLRIVRFAAAATLVHNAVALVLIGGANRVTAAGDQGVYVSDAAGNWREVVYIRADGTPLALAAASVTEPKMASASVAARALEQTAIAGMSLINGTLAVSLNLGAMTIAKKTLSAANPSASSPVHTVVPNNTGGYAVISRTSAQSLVISAGSTLGVQANTPFRLWFVEFNDGGTGRLGAILCSTVNIITGFVQTTVFTLDDWNIKSATAEGGAGGADSAGVIYADAAVAAKNFAIIGFAEWDTGLAVPGTWDVAPSRVVLWGRGMPRPGDAIAPAALVHNGLLASGTTILPADDSIPQISEGDQYLTRDITPSSPMNLLDVDCQIHLGSATGQWITAALFRDAGPSALAVASHFQASTGSMTQIGLRHTVLASSTALTTFRVRAGSLSGTMSFNGNSAASRMFGGALSSYLRITERMG